LAGDRGHPRWGLRRVLAVAGAGLAVLCLGGIAILAFTDVSPRSVLPQEEEAVCNPRTARIRLPLSGRADATWQPGPSLPFAQDEVRAAAVGDDILLGSGLVPSRSALGGFASLDRLYRFDPDTGGYEAVAPLPMRVDHPAFAAHGDSLYVFGGWSDGVPTARSFELDDGRWEELPEMPTARAGAAAAVVGNEIVVIGGTLADHTSGALDGSRTVESFDLEQRRWRSLPDMPTPRHHHAAVAVGHVITVVGGRDGDRFSVATVEQLDTATDRWVEARPLPLAVGATTAVAVDGEVVVTGGGDDAGGWVTPATWRLRDGAWQRLPDLAVPRHGHGMAAADGVVYVFGGSPCAGYGLTSSVERLMLR
jgi:non-specific serine/threonine protein kinase